MGRAIIPVYCANCGALFSSRALDFRGSIRNLQIRNCREDCPFCGQMAQIVDGVFHVADGVLSIVSAPSVTKQMLAALEAVVTKAYREKQPSEELAKEVEKIDPTFGDVVRKACLKVGLPLVLMILLAAIKSCSVDAKVDVKLDANRLIEQLMNTPPAASAHEKAKSK